MNESPAVSSETKHPPRSTARCELCGVTSTLPELFQRGRTNQHRSGLLCPRCLADRQASNNKWFIEAMCLIVVLGLLMWARGLEHLGFIMLSLACGFFFTVILTPLHELAHALTALALGMPVYSIVIGWFGKPLFKFYWRRCTFEVTRVPLGGLTYAAHRSCRHIRLKEILFVAAGPLLHVALLIIAWQVVANADQHGWLPGSIVWLVIVFGLANAFEIVLNLWPRTFRLAIGELPNDGLALFRLTFSPRSEMQASPLAYYYYESLARLRQDDHAGAIECLQEGLAEFPADTYLRSCYAMVLLQQGDCDKAVRVFEEIRQRPETTGENDAILLNGIAWSDVVSWKPENLERAQDCSLRAIEALPWRAEIKGTRGSVLVMSGDFENGVCLLEQAFVENEERDNRALNAAFLALAAARLGKPEKARDWLRQSERLDPRCRQLQHIRQEIGSVTGAMTDGVIGQ